MQYLDNLIAWGDRLFRQDTIEAINEATTLYVLAYELLGAGRCRCRLARDDRSYNDLTADDALDPFGNAKVEVLVENLADSPVQVVRTDDGAEPLPVLEIRYFGIPPNDQLLELLGHGRRPAVQDPPLHEPRRRRAPAAAVRAADRPGAAGQGRGRGHRHRHACCRAAASAAASTAASRCCRRRSTSPATCAPSATSSSARCRTSTPRRCRCCAPPRSWRCSTPSPR